MRYRGANAAVLCGHTRVKSPTVQQRQHQHQHQQKQVTKHIHTHVTKEDADGQPSPYSPDGAESIQQEVGLLLTVSYPESSQQLGKDTAVGLVKPQPFVDLCGHLGFWDIGEGGEAASSV